MEVGILYVRQKPNSYTLFVEDGLGFTITIDEDYINNICIERHEFKPFSELTQYYAPDDGSKFTRKQKKIILKFLFKEF